MVELEPWLQTITPSERGLEIGPLHRPRFPKASFDIRYVDHATRDELVSSYSDNGDMAGELDHIVDVDYVWDGSTPLAGVVAAAGPFDYVFASHVIEHIPNVVGWLRELADVLRPGGRLYLAIPDKRLCFDVNRAETGIADVMDAYLRDLRAPSYRQIWDFHSNMIAVDPAAMWAGSANYDGQLRSDLDPDGWALELCRRSDQPGQYVDSHCWVFTPTSFLRLYQRLVGLDLIDYRIATFVPSQPGTIEFRVVFEKVAPELQGEARRMLLLDSVPRFVDVVPKPAESPPTSAAGRPAPTLSPKEIEFIYRKRELFEAARHKLGRLRGRLS